MTDMKVSRQTIGREYGIYARIAISKPLLSKKNMIAKFELSEKILGILRMKWKNVIFSDESSFELFLTRKREIIYREKNSAY